MKISRATAAKIIDCNFEYLRYIEEQKLITPSEITGYSYNQLIFARIIVQAKNVSGTKQFAPFVNIFGTTAQYEVIFSEIDLLLISNGNLFGIPSVKDDVKLVCDEWLFPVTEEAFLATDLSESNFQVLKQLAKTLNCYIIKSNFMIIIPVYRVRNFIENRITDPDLKLKLTMAKKKDKFDLQGATLIG